MSGSSTASSLPRHVQTIVRGGKMRHLIRLSAVVAAMATALLGAPAVLANADEGGHHAVFVQTNDLNGNSIAAYSQNENGSLTYAATYPTGGNGGRAAGAVVDPLASQSSLVYDSEHHLLLAPNAGSDTVSVFKVHGDRLRLEQIVASGGPFPASITVHDNLAFVLDAGLAGYVQGYRIAGGSLHPIAGSQRSLGLANSNPPAFLQSPAQVGFTPDGRHLVITINDNGSVALGNPLAATGIPGSVDMAASRDGHFLYAQSGASGSVNAFSVSEDGSLSPIGSWTVPDGGSQEGIAAE